MSPDKRDAGEASSANERGLENYAAFSGVTSASSTLGFSVSDGVRSTGGRSLERRNIEFKTLTIPDGGLRYRSACLFDQLRTSPTRSQIPNTNRTDTIRKMHQSEADIASVNTGKTPASCRSISRLRGDFVVEVLFIQRFPLG